MTAEVDAMLAVPTCHAPCIDRVHSSAPARFLPTLEGVFHAELWCKSALNPVKKSCFKLVCAKPAVLLIKSCTKQIPFLKGTVLRRASEQCFERENQAFGLIRET